MIRRELAVFLVVGTLTVLLDFFVYRGLVAWAAFGVDAAKGISFFVGTVFAYFANRHWTFGQKAARAGSAWRFAVLYATTLAANVVLNAWVLAGLANSYSAAVAVQGAFLLATGVSAVLNFLGMKFFVFAAPSQTTSP